jgi:hypothetical protein
MNSGNSEETKEKQDKIRFKVNCVSVVLYCVFAVNLISTFAGCLSDFVQKQN